MKKHFKNFVVTYFLFYILFFFGCSPTTELTRMSSEYSPVIPIRAKLTADFASNVQANGSNYYEHHQQRDDDPFVQIKVLKWTLLHKVYTKYYATKRYDKKTWEAVGGIALLGASGGLFVLGANSNASDTSTKILGIGGGILAGLGGIYLTFKAAPVDDWTADSVAVSDTMYSLLKNSDSYITHKYLSVKNLNNKKSELLYSNYESIISLDVRKYADSSKPLIDVPVEISYEQAQPCRITIPRNYIERVIENEALANKMNDEVESEIASSKYSDAINTIKLLSERYPKTKKVSYVESEIPLLQEKAREQKNNNLLRELDDVSSEKVPGAVDNAGITESELNEISYRFQSISNSQITSMMGDYGLSIDYNAAIVKFNILSSSQKIFLLLSASENLGGSKAWQIQQLLNISQPIADKLGLIKSRSLLRR